MDDSPDQQDKQRIEELEQEVAQLRTELASQQSAKMLESLDNAPQGSQGISPEESKAVKSLFPSQHKAIVVAVLIGFLALGGIVAIVLGLSTVIKPFSQKAAEAMSPWEDPGMTSSPRPPRQKKTPPQPKSEDHNLPPVPGL
jgi:hypothetical protein